MVDRFLALGPKATDGDDADIPQLSANPGAFEQLKTTLGLTIQNRLAILCPGAEYGPAKRWPVEHFATLTRQLQQAGYTVWTIGSAKDQESGSAIESLSDGIAINLCGRTKLADAIDLMSRADIVVSNDSGLMHVAAALQRPLIALFGSSSPQFTPPLSKQVAILQHSVPCSPCFARTCRYGHMDCLTQLLPETVMASIRTLTPESPTA
jgi:heptosyltransferase-2